MENAYYIGTSGWSYEGWLGNFYPEKMKSNQILPYYAEIFDSVELNNSFYQIPKEKNIKIWLDLTPKNFVFSCKANRYITHMKKLNNVEESVDRLLRAFFCFEEKLGPILFQFPPYWPVDLGILSQFIKFLPKDYLYTFEFRHKSWFCDDLYALLHAHRMALCFYNYKQYSSPEIITAPFIYLRMHGPNEHAYTGSYEESVLLTYADKFKQWHVEGKKVFCYFDNDEKANAPKDAKRLKNLLDNQPHGL